MAVGGGGGGLGLPPPMMFEELMIHLIRGAIKSVENLKRSKGVGEGGTPSPHDVGRSDDSSRGAMSQQERVR